MAKDAKTATEVKPQEGEPTSGEPITEEGKPIKGEPTEDKPEDQKFIPKERFDQVNGRMKASEERSRAQDAELAQMRADLAAMRTKDAPVPDPVDAVAEFEGKPVEFVKHFTKQSEDRMEKKFGVLEGENKNLKFQLQVQEAAGRLEDFNDYREDIIGLIKDPNFRAINPNETGAIDLYYTVARERRSALTRSENLQSSAPKVPHTESSRKRTRPIAKDPRDMTLAELREHIGTTDSD